MKHVFLGSLVSLLVVGALSISGVSNDSINPGAIAFDNRVAVADSQPMLEPVELAMHRDTGMAIRPETTTIGSESESYLISKALLPEPGNYEKSDKPTHPYRVEINLPACRLRLYEGDKVKKVFPICVGHPAHPSPIKSHMSIKSLIWNPAWGPPPDSAWASRSAARAPGKMNPMGVVKMPIRGMIFIHGTYKIKSLGFAWSHGCIRMANEDAMELAWFFQQTIGCNRPTDSLENYISSRRSKVVYLNQPVPVKTIYETVEIRDGRLFIHPDIYRKRVTTERKVLSIIKEAGLDINKIELSKIRRMIARSRTETALAPIEDLLKAPTRTADSGR